MKTLFTRIFILFVFTLAFALPTWAEPVTYTFDPYHSYILWHINHFGFSNPSGKWMVNGTLNLDEAKPENSSVNATIQIADLITGIPKLDEHLKSADFFDVAKYPTATFVSNKVHVAANNTAWVFGTLTLHGVSKPVTLEIKLNKLGINPFTQKKTAGFTGSAELHRSDFGISKYLPGLGDVINIEIEAEASTATTTSPLTITAPATANSTTIANSTTANTTTAAPKTATNSN